MPDLAIYFAVPEAQNLSPLIDDLQELGAGLYVLEPNSHLKRVVNDRVPFDDTLICYPIEPDKPYRNKQNVLKVLANCTNRIWWLDKHFTVEGLEFIYEHSMRRPLRGPLSDVRILGSDAIGAGDLARLRADFPAFSLELAGVGITAEMRIITDQNVRGSIHDRYIISETVAFNVLPIRSLLRGQTGSLILDDNPPDFQAIWRNSTNL